jgi:hypothetical protein
MGVLPHQLARHLRDHLGLVRAIETGTYKGGSARILASVFDEVITIELDPELHARAVDRLAGIPSITAVHGSSRDRLAPLVDPTRPTLYWLDGHWSGDGTAGEEDECPVLDELHAVGEGHPDDCILIDDARLFLEPPPPPHKSEHWPTFDDIAAAILSARPEHRVEVLHDIVVAVPPSAGDLAERFGRRRPKRTSLIRRALSRALGG